VDSPDLLIS